VSDTFINNAFSTTPIFGRLGIGLGIVAAIFLSRALETLLFGVERLIPTVRATRVDPISTLRHELERLRAPRLRFTRERLGRQFIETLFVRFREIADVPEAPVKCFRGDSR